MSFILNALRKSEQERQSLNAETVTDRILINQPEQDKSKAVKLYAIIGIVNVLLIVGIVWFLKNNSVLSVNPTTPAVLTNLPLPEVSDKAKQAVKVISPEKKIQSSATKNTSIEALVGAEKPKVTTEIKKPLIPKATQVESINQSPVGNKSDSVVQIKPDIKVDEPSSASFHGSEPAKNDIPFLSNLPSDDSRAIPKLNINVFVYSEHTEESFVMIDMVKYKAGQHLENGMILKAIRPDSLVIDYQGRVFQLERP
ncbi:MAG: general secretion pathway protein GspB [Methylococcales bacterium]|nr:general secretion pathway protein GspB [Methylococcales bacterium]